MTNEHETDEGLPQEGSYSHPTSEQIERLLRNRSVWAERPTGMAKCDPLLFLANDHSLVSVRPSSATPAQLMRKTAFVLAFGCVASFLLNQHIFAQRDHVEPTEISSQADARPAYGSFSLEEFLELGALSSPETSGSDTS